MSWIEIIGYVGSVLVAVSLMMSSLVKLRWINLVGAVAFAIYGGLVGAHPVLAVNAFIAGVNLFYLWRMNRQRDYFTLLPIQRRDNSFLRGFLQFHATDIARFFPDFDFERLEMPRMVFILRDMNPAGLVVFAEEKQDVVIHLDYVLPQYRDLRCARFFLGEMADRWRRRGRRRILSSASGAMHRDYLRRLGFQPSLPDGLTLFERSLADRGPENEDPSA
jgi:GNAT superfamily N-acetyltransferase